MRFALTVIAAGVVFVLAVLGIFALLTIAFVL